MSDPGPALQRMMLGVELRRLREAAGLTNQRAAELLGWQTAKLSKVEAGNAKVSEVDLTALIRAYRVPSDHVGQLRQLATAARRRVRPSRVPDWAAKYLALESAATRLGAFAEGYIPGPFQTFGYARAVLLGGVSVALTDVDDIARERAQRLDKLSPSALVCLVLGEAAIRQLIGGREVMVEQLRWLLDAASRDNITVQVLPFEAPAHPAHGISFALLELGGNTMVYQESLISADYLVKEPHVRPFELALGRVLGAALSRDASAELIRDRITRLEQR